MVETELIERKELREQMVGRVEVLSKVKKLMLLPKLDMMTTQQIADYYEVSVNTVKGCYKDNKDEINEDGTAMQTINDLLKLDYPTLEKTQYRTVFQVSDNVALEVPNRGIRMFSQRAILRIGMLLRDSEVAKEVRTQLLNTFEHSTVEQRTADIDEELKLQADVGKAFMNMARTLVTLVVR